MFHLTVAYVLQAEREREIADGLRQRDVLRAPDSARDPIEPPSRTTGAPRRSPVQARAGGR